MNFLRPPNYDGITNGRLLEIARKKGMRVSPTWNNRLTIVRGIPDDRIGSADRQEFIGVLRAHDALGSSRRANIIAFLALLVALVSLFWSTG